jgi:trimethylguanosine synthase
MSPATKTTAAVTASSPSVFDTTSSTSSTTTTATPLQQGSSDGSVTTTTSTTATAHHGIAPETPAAPHSPSPLHRNSETTTIRDDEEENLDRPLLSILMERKNLYDATTFIDRHHDADHHDEFGAGENNDDRHHQHAKLIAPYFFQPEESISTNGGGGDGRSYNNNARQQQQHQQQIAMVRLEASPPILCGNNSNDDADVATTTTTLPTPPPSTLPDHCQKYWHQRHTLFSRFDQGIQLDPEGWFSVTPEHIANHVAAQVPYLVLRQDDDHDHNNDGTTAADATAPPSSSPPALPGIVVLDAFSGCGGNAIAFAQRPDISLVVCVDLDRDKLRRAAHNAYIYGIPSAKMIFVECNAIFLLQFCYHNGQFVLDAPLADVEMAMAMMAAMPPAVAPTERYRNYQIGGLDLLPRDIDVVFLDPPWGGVDYNAFGRFGYSLHEHMRIPRRHGHLQERAQADAFFDSFAPTTDYERKALFNCTLDDTNCVTGAELLTLAARAARDARVIYDVPRNVNRRSLGAAALEAGYLGNVKLDEHYWNGRLKTVTAYFGRDWRRRRTCKGT